MAESCDKSSAQGGLLQSRLAAVLFHRLGRLKSSLLLRLRALTL